MTYHKEKGDACMAAEHVNTVELVGVLHFVKGKQYDENRGGRYYRFSLRQGFRPGAQGLDSAATRGNPHSSYRGDPFFRGKRSHVRTCHHAGASSIGQNCGKQRFKSKPTSDIFGVSLPENPRLLKNNAVAHPARSSCRMCFCGFFGRRRKKEFFQEKKLLSPEKGLFCL